MPPKKRKATEASAGDDDAVTPTPKKSKKEIRAEARAKAKAWHDARHGKPSSSTPAAATATKKSSASPTFSAGKSTTTTTTTTTPTPPRSATKRRRTPSRKSTGGIIPSSSSRTSSSRETPVKRGRRSMGANVASTGFEFAPPVAEEAKDTDEEEETSEPETKEVAVGTSSSAKKTSPKFEFGSSEKHKKIEEGRARLRALREERESKGLKVSHTKPHHPTPHEYVESTHHYATRAEDAVGERKSPPKMSSPDPPAAAVASLTGATAATTRAPDPFASSATAMAAAKSASVTPTAALAATKMNSPDPPSTTKPPAARATAAAASAKRPTKKPPASVAGIFAKSSTSKYTSAHRPNKQRFDPNRPFPAGGYKLPTAAYCGCGPTPGSATTSVRSNVGSALGAYGMGSGGTASYPATAAEAAAMPGVGGDLCMMQRTNSKEFLNRGSVTAANMKESMQRMTMTPVDPPYRKRSSADIMEVASSKPSPPGRNADGEEMQEEQLDGANGKAGQVDAPFPAAAAPVPASTPIQATVPTAAAGAAPVNTPGMLSAAMSRATALISSAAAGNQQRRAMMGIRSAAIASSNGTSAAVGGNNQLGAPPRNVMMTEQQMDAVNAAALDDEVENEGNANGDKGLDPPMIDSSSISYGATLQKFREAGGEQKTKPSALSVSQQRDDIPVKKEPVEGTETTDAGEHTSEVGQEEEAKHSVATEEAAQHKKPSSFLMRACLSILKLIMFVQMAIGIIYLATNTSFEWKDYIAIDGSFDWKDYIPSTPQLFQSSSDNTSSETSTIPEMEKIPTCFIDYPTLDNDEDLTVDEIDGCKDGNYKQCPPWGQCDNGKLQDCNDGDGVFQGLVRFVPNENGDGCVVSPEAKVFIGMVQEALMDMTAAQNCKSANRVTDAEDVLFGDDDSFPLFRLESVAEQVRRTQDKETGIMSPVFLLWLHPTFDSESVRFGALSGDEGDDFDAMGLGSGISPNSLPLPMSCTLKLMFFELLEFFATSAWALLTFSAVKGWFLLRNYPIHTLVFLVFWKSLLFLRQRRKHRAKVRELFAIVLEAVYDRLSECEDHEGYAALLLRDDVGHDMYPTSFVQRNFINQNVWPRVILEVRADNRVRKFRRMRDGKELEHWDFAVQSKRGRRLRKSFGTPGSHPGVAVKKEEPADP